MPETLEVGVITKTPEEIKNEYESMMQKLKEDFAKENAEMKTKVEQIEKEKKESDEIRAKEKRDADLAKLDEEAKKEFIRKEEMDKLIKERDAEKEARLRAEDESRIFKEEKKGVELDKEKNKLIEKYPLLKTEISKLKSWEGVNAFLDIKDVLSERAEKLAKYDELNAKSGYNVFSNSVSDDNRSKSEFQSVFDKKKEEIIKKMTKK